MDHPDRTAQRHHPDCPGPPPTIAENPGTPDPHRQKMDPTDARPVALADRLHRRAHPHPRTSRPHLTLRSVPPTPIDRSPTTANPPLPGNVTKRSRGNVASPATDTNHAIRPHQRPIDPAHARSARQTLTRPSHSVVSGLGVAAGGVLLTESALRVAGSDRPGPAAHVVAWLGRGPGEWRSDVSVESAECDLDLAASRRFVL